MKLKSTLFALLSFFCASVFAQYDLFPSVTPSAFCGGDTITVIITTPDTFPAGNVFTLKLANGLLDAHPAFLGSGTSRVTDTVKVVAPNVNGNNFYITVESSNDSVGVINNPISIYTIPTVSFQLPQNSYCTYAYDVVLSGGSPAGGVFSGNYVQDSLFQAYQSGTGTFEVYYTAGYPGCTAIDSAAITIATCPAPSVAVTVSPSSLCPGGVMNISIQTSYEIANDNVFTVQLSDSTGSFANATVLATDTYYTNTSFQIATPNEPAGSNYQVRVIASDPSTISVNYGITFRTLLAPPAVQLNDTGMLSICTRDSVKLSVDSVFGVLYQWSFNGVPFTVSKYKYTAKDSGLYVVAFNDTLAAGCSSGSDSLFIGIYPYPSKPSITPTGTVDFCGVGTVALSTTANNAVTFQWADHGRNISGATQTSYAVSVTGVYLVRAVSPSGCSTNSDSVHVNIHTDPNVTLTLPFDSFCVNSAPIALTGGSPYGSNSFFSGNFTSGNATFNPDSSGVGSFEIYYTYIDSIGCVGKDSAKVKVYNCTTLPSGINEISRKPDFEMFPNPASGKVSISTNGLADCKMRLFNLLGQEISSQQFNTQLTYSLEKLPSGVYMVEISNLSDSWKAVKRLVVQ